MSEGARDHFFSFLFKSADVINAYAYAFQFACHILPSFSQEKKALRLSLMDSLCEQAFGGVMVLGDNEEYLWKPNNRIHVRINDLHKAAALFYYGDRKLDLHWIKKSLKTLEKRFPSHHLIAKKSKALLDHISLVTSTWQADAINFIKDLVSKFFFRHIN